MDPSLERELCDLAKPYSPLRAGCTKWSSIKLQSKLKSGLQYEIQDLDGQVVGLVSRDDEGVVYGYKVDAIGSRLAMKRSKVMFLSMYTVWKLINPFALKGIAKPLYLDLLLTLYRSVFCISEDYPSLPQYVAGDCKLDFSPHSALVFSEFYHSLFLCVDSFTRSKLVSEYVRAINKLAEVISASTWLDSKDLHNRLHISGQLPRSYEGWMKPVLKDFHAPCVTPGRATKREDNTEERATLRPLLRLSSAPVTKPRELPLARTYLRNVQLLLQEGRKTKQRRKNEQSEGYASSRVSPMKYSIRFRNLKHLSEISPLSKVSHRRKRDTNLLEDVLQRRSRESLAHFTPLQTARF